MPEPLKKISTPFAPEQVPTRDYEPRSPSPPRPERVYELDENGDPPLLQGNSLMR